MKVTGERRDMMQLKLLNNPHITTTLTTWNAGTMNACVGSWNFE
jgi:hypothetical protein